MTEPEKQIIAAHIRSNTNPDIVAALSIRNEVEMARLYNPQRH